MREIVGQAAGQIWHLLANYTEPVNIKDIPKRKKLTDQIDYQGLGWIAPRIKLSTSKKAGLFWSALGNDINDIT